MSVYRICIVLFLLSLIDGTVLWCQTPVIDSLINELKTVEDDSLKIEILGALSDGFWPLNLDSSELFANKALKLSRENNDDILTSKSLYKLAGTYFYKGAFQDGLDLADKGILLAQKANANDVLRNLFIVRSLLRKNIGEYEAAIEDGHAAIDLMEDDNLHKYFIYNNLSGVYEEIGQTDHAKKYARLACDGLRRHEQWRALGQALLSLSMAIEDKTSEEYKTVVDESLSMGQKLQDNSILQSANINLGVHYLNLESYDLATHHYKEAMNYSKALGDSTAYYKSFSQVGLISSFLKKSGLAESSLLQAKSYYERNNKVSSLSKTLDWLAHHYEENNQYKKAFKTLAERQKLRDSIFTSELSENTMRFEAKFEAQQKEKQIAEQRLEIADQTNARNRVLFGGIAALLLASSIFTWYYQRQKRKKQEAELALQLEKAEADNLRHLDELKSNFFTNLSHELRTPLTLILGPLAKAKEKVKDHTAKHDIELAHGNASKLHGLVNEIMDLSKLEAGKLEMHKRQLAFIPLLRRIYFSFESLAKMRGIKLDFENQLADNYMVETDLKRFEKVINNLVSNAIKFSDNDNRIIMRVDCEAGSVSIQIQDFGKGIHPEDLPYVFDRFYQSSKTGGHLEGGTGIGLAYAREIVERFGGQLSVESDQGLGSTFTVSLPKENFFKVEDLPVESSEVVQEKEDEAVTEKDAYVPLIIDGAKPRVLVVEDNIEMQEYLRSLLRPNYRVTLAADGQSALQILRGQHFDLITSDIMMPRMDGFEFREKVMQSDEQRNIPFVMLTARSLEEDKLRGLRMGVDDYLTKPFSADELMARVDNLLRNKKERDAAEKEDGLDAELTAGQQILKQAEEYVLAHLDDAKLNVPDLAKALGYSQRQIARVMKKLTGLTPVNFILEMRLQRARQLFEAQKYLSVDEVRYETGIESASYFSRKFKERFGKSPSEYLT